MNEDFFIKLYMTWNVTIMFFLNLRPSDLIKTWTYVLTNTFLLVYYNFLPGCSSSCFVGSTCSCYSAGANGNTRSSFARYWITRLLPQVSYKLCIKGAYWISSSSSFIQYWDSNVGLFSIAPPLVITLPTLR